MDTDIKMFIADKEININNIGYSLKEDSLELTFTAKLGNQVPVKILLTKKEYINYTENSNNDEKKE
jgi:hypothetical protein